VTARDELGLRVAAVVDDRFVDAAEARAWIRRDELEVECLQDIDHEVATRPIRGDDFSALGRINLARCDRSGCLSRWV
jgi:hypothetical protein